MREYTFRFRDSSWHIEAEFCLHFDSDAEARSTAGDLMDHSRFPVLEVKLGEALVCQLEARNRKRDAA